MRTDEAMEIALAKLTEDGRTRTEAVRHALLRVSGQQPFEQPALETQQSATEPDDRAEMLAIQRFMGVAN